MNRKLLYLLTIYCLTVASNSVFLWQHATAQERPNVLWISAEDISPHFGCYGDENAITPNVDQLAKTGVKYTRAFTTAGVCAPCRSGIITGVYQSTLGTHHMRCSATLPNFIKPFPTYLRDAGYYCTNNSKQDYQFKTPKGTWDKSGKKAHWKNRPDKNQPFFAVFNFTGCHESGIADSSKYQSVTAGLNSEQRQDSSKLSLPPYYPDTPVVREDWKRNYELITAMDAWAGDLIQDLKDEGVYENTIIMFWSDHGVGLPRAKRWLYDSGTRIPLIVHVPEKFRLGDQATPGGTSTELISSIDFGPTVLNLAGIEIPEHMQGRAFLGENLTKKRRFVFGARDRMDERYDIIRSVRTKRFRYIRNYEPFKPYYQFMNTPEKGATMKELRRCKANGELPDPAKLFMANSKPKEELYDLINDPHEINNLADNPKHETTLQQMREFHLAWVLESRDMGLIPESEIVRLEKTNSSRYSILLKTEPDLIKRIRDTANMALLGRQSYPDLMIALQDPNPVVRYWAAMGLGNIGVDARSSGQLLTDALKDEAPCVRIAAARALLKIGESESALAALKNELVSEHQWGRLRAAIVLNEAGEQARPLIPELKACLENQPNKYITRVANRALNVLEGTERQVK